MSAMKHSLIGLLAMTQLACSSWPNYGHGGEAERFAAQDYYQSAAHLNPVHRHGGEAERFAVQNYYSSVAQLTQTHGHVRSQLETQQAQLDVLTLQGALYCIPAAVKKLNSLSHRIRREIAGDLLVDAAHNLVVLQHELRFFRQQFFGIAQQTGCALPPSVPTTITQPIFSVYFDKNQAELSATYQQQISWWGQYFNDQTVLRVRAHTDADGSIENNETLAEKRLSTVLQVLAHAGVKPSQIQTEILGERELILQGQDDFAEGLNRRVDIWLKPESNEATRLPASQWETLNLKQYRQVLPGWQ